VLEKKEEPPYRPKGFCSLPVESGASKSFQMGHHCWKTVPRTHNFPIIIHPLKETLGDSIFWICYKTIIGKEQVRYRRLVE
jgi:hypothetical protein